ncbi:hypothetical protein OOZ51_00320 [Arthrobacter sp. MI7-26]|uniref:hypothetical protein n=1 Tax=Arthrobacter sp. MI7-26 TaxID=2993653 RepID=UPI0022487760|nr:hypothetical protein [Arthrobacter sp. MI7-26]MCX2746257.1 hypothetical protein [Arthrobacter sp. MI7-26]
MEGNIRLPEYEKLIAELSKLREKGLGELRRLQLPALHEACMLAGFTTGLPAVPSAIEQLLRQAVDALGGGTAQDAAEYTFGLVPGTKLWPANARRAEAAAKYDVVAETFRKKAEKQLIEQTADGVLGLCHDSAMRETRKAMEQRHPADSRLAVEWVKRFEAYNRMWTPAWALAADLQAALEVRLEEPGEHAPWDPDGNEKTGYFDPAAEGAAYARSALFDLAWFLLEVRKFMSTHGGMWLMSDTETEEKISDIVYKVGWHNPLNSDETSWLRRQLGDARYQEEEHFTHLLKNTSQGPGILERWVAWVRRCECADTVEGSEGCEVHETMRTARAYCETIDGDWVKIADWYRPGSTPGKGTNGRLLYKDRLRQVEPFTQSNGQSI